MRDHEAKMIEAITGPRPAARRLPGRPLGLLAALLLAGLAAAFSACASSEDSTGADGSGGEFDAGGSPPVSGSVGTSTGAGGAETSDTAAQPGGGSATDTGTATSGPGGSAGGGGDGPTGFEPEPECTPATIRYDASSDDSNSMASPMIARELLSLGIAPPDASLRTHEFLNHYHAGHVADPGQIDVRARLRPAPETDAGSHGYELEVSVVAGPALDPPPLFLTVALDASGSMKGTGLERGRAAVRAIAERLGPEDRMTLLAWREVPALLFENLGAAEAQAKLEEALASVKPRGDSNLSEGVRTAFELARQHHDASVTSRVVVISDGGANAGEETKSDVEKFAATSDERGDIYLVGVGVGPGLGYDDTLMDALTDAGRGAYVYLDGPGAAETVLGERFDEVMRVAAREVDVNITLPDHFKIASFSGEGISAETEQRDQHLAPGGAMLFALRLEANDTASTCPLDPENPARGIAVDVDYTLPFTTDTTNTRALSVQSDPIPSEELGLFLKTFAVFAYAEALRADDPQGPPRSERLASALARVEKARETLPADPDLEEIAKLIRLHPDFAEP